MDWKKRNWRSWKEVRNKLERFGILPVLVLRHFFPRLFKRFVSCKIVNLFHLHRTRYSLILPVVFILRYFKF